MTLLQLLQAEQAMTYPDNKIGTKLTAEGTSDGVKKGWETRKANNASYHALDWQKLDLTEQLTLSQLASIKRLSTPTTDQEESLQKLKELGYTEQGRNGWKLTRDGDSLRKGMENFKETLRRPTYANK